MGDILFKNSFLKAGWLFQHTLMQVHVRAAYHWTPLITTTPNYEHLCTYMARKNLAAGK